MFFAWSARILLGCKYIHIQFTHAPVTTLHSFVIGYIDQNYFHNHLFHCKSTLKVFLQKHILESCFYHLLTYLASYKNCSRLDLCNISNLKVLWLATTSFLTLDILLLKPELRSLPLSLRSWWDNSMKIVGTRQTIIKSKNRKSKTRLVSEWWVFWLYAC